MDSLSVVLHYEDEWPARVAELIADVAERTADACGPELTCDEIAGRLLLALEKQSVIHHLPPMLNDATGNASYVAKSTVDLDHVREVLASAAAELQAEALLV